MKSISSDINRTLCENMHRRIAIAINVSKTNGSVTNGSVILKLWIDLSSKIKINLDRLISNEMFK